ncbi:hypothetical protein COY93_00320 [Candidatus Uhrbacteria bacterium CG_4_10_14_0_8_um_filter_58_22]|uniref:YibE/F family protein n=1 Tax=Candidatus Uhrbacteria bacterium CG_4_10_14_0_8_um_filter_58_22 TaxID=1975029 RepID=A0A2M7QC51_9BACT|nr:MAG: hypothetical protein AUJ19_03435 [Parcubacteria group bacterium CG1_02_58_44]PIY63363.1 MAG: hypothetical protein COY93_00320 [Candidatus Uhrbacteria bacterium CG_4_10_14_0_8_um_filter_58_22]
MKTAQRRKRLLTAALLTLTLLTSVAVRPAAAQEMKDDGNQMFRAVVTEVTESRSETRENGSVSVGQKLKLRRLDGEIMDREITYDGLDYDVLSTNEYRPGDEVFVTRNLNLDGNETFYIVDRVRTWPLFWLALLFATLVVAVGRLKGLRALIVLGLTFAVILKFIVPLVLAGHSPLLVGIVGSVMILFFAIYVTEGFDRASHLAVVATVVSLTMTGLLSSAFIGLAQLTGFESEDAMFLATSGGGAVNVRGLLLVGIVIGTLGVLDDVVISQIAVVEELKRADPSSDSRTIYRRAMSVGISHLSSMVNTLFLTYAGASLPLLMLFSINGLAPLGFDQAISNEMLATEIVRTLVGSIGLVAVVPISTLLAVKFLPSTAAVLRPRKM